MTAGPNRACNAPGRGRRTNNGGNALGLRGLAQDEPASTEDRESALCTFASRGFEMVCLEPGAAMAGFGARSFAVGFLPSVG